MRDEADAKSDSTTRAIACPGNLDLAPDAMYDAIKAAGVWIPE